MGFLSWYYHHIPSRDSGGDFSIYAADHPFQPCGDRIDNTTMKTPNEIKRPSIQKNALVSTPVNILSTPILNVFNPPI
jgi:hypothetical protein